MPNLSDLHAVLIDLDGVMYRGDTALPGAADLLPALHELGLSYTFVTNNSTLAPEDLAEKLNRMGVGTDPEHVVTSAQATAAYLRTVTPQGARVMSIGEQGLSLALQDEGFEVAEDQVAAVVVGLDRHVTYEKLARATMAIHAGASFIATNADPGLPVEGGWWPGAGAIVAAIVTATGTSPTIIGKPEPELLYAALKRLNIPPERAAMLGDQIHSDVRAGKAAGMRTILIGTDRPNADAEPAPDLWVPDLAALINELNDARAA